MSLSPGNWSACEVFESDCVMMVLLFLTRPGSHFLCSNISNTTYVCCEKARLIYWSWSAELVCQFGTPRPAAAWRGAAVGVRERSLRGEDAVLRPCGLHTDHEQVEHHRDLRDC